MAVADFLEKVGKGLETGAKVAGAVAAPVGSAIVNEEAGYAPQIAAEQRRRQEKLEDEQIAAKEQELTAQLETGRKYGTLTLEQQGQYVDAITQLYSHPRHAGTLMEKLRKAVHPNGAKASPNALSTLKSAVPEGGELHADTEEAKKLAQAKYAAARGNNPRLVSLDSFTGEHFGIDFNASTPEQQEAALEAYGKSTRAEKMVTKIVVDPDSPTGFSAATWDVDKNTLLSKFPNVTPPKGFYPTERVSKSTDQFGNVTETVSETKPEIPGVGNAPPVKGSEPTTHTSTSAPPSKKPAVASILTNPGGARGVKPVAAAPGGVRNALNGALPPLDANGHIPSGGSNPQVTELANELLDGRDAKDIPMKAKAPAEALARQYGWEQGAFTPKEKILINEAGAKLEQLRNSKSLDVLNSTESRLKIAQVLQSADKQGFVGRTSSALTAGALTPEEQEFVRDYNAAVGVISGLAPLTRGGRPTEASIARLMQEMPSVLQSSSASDAKQRIDQLLQEIKVATATKGTTPLGGVSSSLGGSLEERLNKAYEGSANVGPH
jgi:hypothetical protein